MDTQQVTEPHFKPDEDMEMWMDINRVLYAEGLLPKWQKKAIDGIPEFDWDASHVSPEFRARVIREQDTDARSLMEKIAAERATDMYPSTLSADTTQQAPLTEGMVVLLYRRSGLKIEGAPETPFQLRSREPFVLLGDTTLFALGNAKHPLLQYGDYLPQQDILVPFATSPGITEAIAAHARVVAEAAGAKATKEMLEEMVKVHPLYTSLLSNLERLVAGHASMRQELLDGQLLYGVDAILSYHDECSDCYGTGKAQYIYHGKQSLCEICGGSGHRHNLFYREPGYDESESQPLAYGSNFRAVWREAMTEARKLGWKHILTPDGDRKKVHALRRVA